MLLTTNDNDFDYILFDLSKYSDDEIKDQIFNKVFLEMSLLVMKHIFYPDKLKENIEKILNIGKMYYNEKRGIKFLEKVIRYLYYTQGDDKEDIIYRTVKALENKGELVMTIAEKLIKKGKKEGEKEGIKKGKIEDAKKMIKKGFKIDDIMEITGLSREELEGLGRKS